MSDEKEHNNPSLPLNFVSSMSQIECFHGNNKEQLNVANFIANIDIVATLGRWTQHHKIQVAKIKMKSQALVFLRSNPTLQTETSWENFKSKLISRFTVPQPKAYKIQMFMNAVQKPTESVNEYASRLRLLSLQAMEENSPNSEREIRLKIAEEQLKTQFILGLKHEIRKHVLSKDCKDFASAMQAAKIEEVNEMITQDFSLNFDSNTRSHRLEPSTREIQTH